jgi:hypothetical protein
MTRADDQVEVVEVEELDRGGKEGQKLAVAPNGLGQVLHERRVDAVALDGRRHLPAGMNQAEERSVRIEAAYGLEYLFSASHARQPVVHERYARFKHERHARLKLARYARFKFARYARFKLARYARFKFARHARLKFARHARPTIGVRRFTIHNLTPGSRASGGSRFTT